MGLIPLQGEVRDDAALVKNWEMAMSDQELTEVKNAIYNIDVEIEELQQEVQDYKDFSHDPEALKRARHARVHAGREGIVLTVGTCSCGAHFVRGALYCHTCGKHKDTGRMNPYHDRATWEDGRATENQRIAAKKANDDLHKAFRKDEKIATETEAKIGGAHVEVLREARKEDHPAGKPTLPKKLASPARTPQAKSTEARIKVQDVLAGATRQSPPSPKSKPAGFNLQV